MSLRGSCLCGGCVFEVDGRIGPVGKCHCSKCRKVSGTGSNAVLWARPQNVRWLSGEDLVQTFRRDDGWSSTFCGTCGSPLPMMPEDGSMWFVPAGLLDADPGVGVRGHIWVGAKPAWEVIGDDAPQFAGNGPG